MDMRVIKNEKRLCPCCMEEHEVKTVLLVEQGIFKNKKVEYEASYLFCDVADELYMDERQMLDNDVRLKDAYRKKEGLLTSAEIRDIRVKYGISQDDLCILLDWEEGTITRYESYQVQVRAHDTILRKIDKDPEWLLLLLDGAKESLSADSYQKCLKAATSLSKENQK